jgi:general secretion pathway protein I
MDASRKARRRADLPKGFTLLEVLIAFTILGFALTSLFGAFSTSVVGASRAEEITALTLAGHSKLAEVGRSIPLQPGEDRGELPNGSPWTLVISQIEPLGSDALTQLTVSAYRVVIEMGDREAPTVRLETIRLKGTP